MNGSSHRCWAEIDLAALERNLGKIRAALPSHIRYVAVVKADAYGHGMPQTVARLMQSGADAFAVANVYEAAELREIGAGWPILVLGAVLPEEEAYLLDYDLVATVSTIEEIERLNKLGRKRKSPVRVHLKVDTGMGRLGIWHTEVRPVFEAIAAARHIALEGVFTHFSSADSDPEYTALQRKRFLQVLDKLPELADQKLLIHADNSAGLDTLAPDSPFNAVRVGLLQFGHAPYRGSLLDRIKPEPVLSFHARVSIIKELPSGVPISYSQTHRLRRRSRLAVLTAGYGDGIPTTASNRAEVLIRGQRCPVLGRVTMDQTIVDVTDLPEATPGDVATMIGAQPLPEHLCEPDRRQPQLATITVEEFAHWCHNIPWEIFCSITKRVPRHYRTSREQ
ncbi:alanine racemase [Cerasicoccus frondis]|uniref:alanine racemase n=1 Tax=Cerasicoccus frondis TaxID=490090 RepID=UPI0028528943|nr:alanine racemase [Cerasicoccus frondis]